MAKGDGASISIEKYVDALNVERRHTSNMRSLAIIGTLGGMIFGIFRATNVLALTFEKRMDTTNEWRGALEDQAKGKATVGEVARLKEQLDKIEALVLASGNRSLGGRHMVTMAAIIIGAIAAINGIIFVIQGAT